MSIYLFIYMYYIFIYTCMCTYVPQPYNALGDQKRTLGPLISCHVPAGTRTLAKEASHSFQSCSCDILFVI